MFLDPRRVLCPRWGAVGRGGARWVTVCLGGCQYVSVGHSVPRWLSVCLGMAGHLSRAMAPPVIRGGWHGPRGRLDVLILVGEAQRGPCWMD